MRANLRAAPPELEAAAAIPVERSRASLLLIGGSADLLADSGANVERLLSRLRSTAYSHPYTGLIYPGAGHVLIGTGWRPTTTDNDYPIQNGGTPQADARAQGESWPRVLAFLRRELISGTRGRHRLRRHGS
jgi:dienelactone hydrolase